MADDIAAGDVVVVAKTFDVEGLKSKEGRLLNYLAFTFHVTDNLDGWMDGSSYVIEVHPNPATSCEVQHRHRYVFASSRHCHGV